jgi:putative intracellular protease/amidase
LRILMILTSCGRAPRDRAKIGFELTEFTTPFYAFLAAGFAVDTASPCGGMPPIDPQSLDDADTAARFRRDPDARALLADSLRLDQIVTDDFDGAFVVGGSGAVLDLPGSPYLPVLLESLLSGGRPAALVGLAPAVLCKMFDPAGAPFVSGRQLTAVSDTEPLRRPPPFSLPQEFARLGAEYLSGPPGEGLVVRSGVLLTGQNTASAGPLAEALVETLRAGA